MSIAFFVLTVIIAFIAASVLKTASTMTNGPSNGLIIGGFVLCAAVGGLYGLVVSIFVHAHFLANIAQGTEIGLVAFALTALLKTPTKNV